MAINLPQPFPDELPAAYAHHIGRWKVMLARNVIQIVLGVLLLFDIELGIELFLLAFALLFLFRAVIELISFVEIPGSILSRRWLLLMAILFFALAIRMLIAVFADGVLTIDLIAIYLVFEGGSHLVSALRNQCYHPAGRDIRTGALSRRGNAGRERTAEVEQTAGRS